MTEGVVTMSHQEMDRLGVIQHVFASDGCQRHLCKGSGLPLAKLSLDAKNHLAI